MCLLVECLPHALIASLRTAFLYFFLTRTLEGSEEGPHDAIRSSTQATHVRIRTTIIITVILL
jgi:hypothetical protein